MSRSHYDRATIINIHMFCSPPGSEAGFVFFLIPPLGRVGETDEAGRLRWVKPNLHSLPWTLWKEAKGFNMHGLVTCFVPRSAACFYLSFQISPLRLLLSYLRPHSAFLICFCGHAMEMVVAT